MFRFVLVGILILVLYCSFNNIEMFSIKTHGVNIELGSNDYTINKKNNETNIKNYIGSFKDDENDKIYEDNENRKIREDNENIKKLYKKHGDKYINVSDGFH